MKTKIFGLFLITILAALAFSGTAFAECEAPLPDTAEEPPTPAKQPALPEEPALLEEAPLPAEAPPAEEPPAPTEPELASPVVEPPVVEQPVETEIPVIAEMPETNDEGSIAPSEPVVEVPAITVGDSSTPTDDLETPQPLETLPEPPSVETAAPEIEVQVVDATGAPLDMASQQSAQALSGADPYFTSGIYTYRFSEVSGYCTHSPGSDDPAHCFDPSSSPSVVDAIQYAIDYISDHGTNPNDGLINVEWDTNKYEQDVSINAGDFSVPSALKGLIGKANATTGVFPTIKGNVSINGVTTGFTLSGFTIEGGVTISSVTGALNLTDLDISNPSGNGIAITNQKGNVTLTRVKSSNNNNYGASIDNTAAAGNVAISNSAFDDNGNPDAGYGLMISSNGVVTINGLSASRNFSHGLILNYFSSLTIDNLAANLNTNGINGCGINASTTKIAPVVLRNVIASDNFLNGIDITTKGNISLTAVDAFRNQNGIRLVDIDGLGTVTLNTVRAGNNSLIGIVISSKGAISLTSVKAEENSGGYGAQIDNFTGTGSVTVTSLAAAGFVGANSFSNNSAGVGLYIHSNGAVTVTNTDAFSNGSVGLSIENTAGTVTINKNLLNWANDFSGNGCQGIKISTQGIVNISSSMASRNQWTGIEVTSKGAITLTDVEAFNNGLAASGEYSGLKLANTNGSGGVTIRSSVATDYFDFSNNYYYGISITSNGAVSVGNAIVNNTTSKYGLIIDNRTVSTLTLPAVTISNSKFDFNNWSGIYVQSNGSITLTNVTASANGSSTDDHGVLLDNTSGSASGVTIRSSLPSVYYEYCKNTGYGIDVLSKGAVAIGNVIAEGNGIDGILIQNNGAGDQPVSITASTANGNTQDGIEINTKGIVTLTNTGASDNATGYGVKISNLEGTALTGATISSTLPAIYYDFSSNGLDGIFINSQGAVSVGNVRVCENKNYGLNIERNSAGSAGAVSITRGTFDSNAYGGVQVLSTPSVITLTDVSASHNDPDALPNYYSGVYINSTGSGSGGSVTVKSSSVSTYYDFSSNSRYGLEILTISPVVVSNVTAEGNTLSNIQINNTTAGVATPKPVSLARSSANDSPNGYGIRIDTFGSVTLNNLTANNNLYEGLNISANDPTCLIPANVTLSGTGSEFNENKGNGVTIQTEGNISLTNLSARDNIGVGIYANNDFPGANGNVTIAASGSYWNTSLNNDDLGVDIQSRGTVSISRLRSNENLDIGIRINNNNASPLAKNVTLTSVEAKHNRGDYGLLINSLGAVALTSTTVDSNEQHGIRIVTNGAVTFTGVSASYNSTHEADIPAPSVTIYERLTSDVEGDIWYFTADVASNTITLASADFDAYLVLYHWNTGTNEWEWVTDDDNSLGGTNARIIRSLTIGDDYYILATTDYGWGAAGGAYTLGFNGSSSFLPLIQFYGAFIDNHTGTAGVTVTSPATFWSNFSQNNYNGLDINTSGAVSITNANAVYNNGIGIDTEGISNPTGITIRNTVTTRIMSISNNKSYGIYAPYARGAITLSGLISLYGNGNMGAYLSNILAPAATPMPVTISSVRSQKNTGDGLHITSIGVVTLSNITATDNIGTNAGVYVSNAGSAGRNLTINGTNLISGNTGKGLEAASSGVISITGVRAEDNTSQGIYVNGNGIGKTVTLTNVLAQYNLGSGVTVYADGVTTLNSVRSILNGITGNAPGIFVNANDAHPIYFNSCVVIGNVGSGIWAQSHWEWLHISLNTIYFGNNTDSSIGDKDLWYDTTP